MDVPQVSLKIGVPRSGAAAASLDIFHFGIPRMRCRGPTRPRLGQSCRHRPSAFSHARRGPGNDTLSDQGRQSLWLCRHDPQRKEAISKQEPNLRSRQRRIFEAILEALLTSQPLSGH